MVELFAGISVRDFAGALSWYETVLGAPPAFFPNDVEAVWELAEHRFLYVQDRPDHAGHALTTLIVDDLDARLAALAERGLHPATDETYDNGTRKVTFLDPEGNELGLGSVPA